MSSPLRRLHPATVLIELLRRLGSVSYLIVIALVLRFTGGASKTEFYEYVIAGLTLFSAAGALLRYFTLRFGIQADALVIHSGILVKQNRSIPLDRIQNISLRRGILHRFLDLTDVDIETAGGGAPEAQLSALSLAEADRLKTELLAPRRSAAAGTAAPPVAPPTAPQLVNERIIWVSPLRDLLVAGATENRVGVILAAIGGAWYTFQDAVHGQIESLFKQFNDAFSAELLVVIGGALLLVLILVLCGWIASIAMTVAQYYGFELRRADERLRIKFGLFTQHENLVPPQRIQLVRLEAPWLRDRIGRVTAYASTAGSIVDKANAGSVMLCPIIHRIRIGALLRQVFETLDLDAVRWLPVSRLTIRRAAIRYALLSLLLIAPVVVYYGPVALAALPIMLLLGYVGAILRYRGLGYRLGDDFVLARSGVLTRRCWIVPRGKVQYVELDQTPFQRRLGLANLTIYTAGGQNGNAVIVDLPAETALELQEELARVRHEPAAQRDGV